MKPFRLFHEIWNSFIEDSSLPEYTVRIFKISWILIIHSVNISTHSEAFWHLSNAFEGFHREMGIFSALWEILLYSEIHLILSSQQQYQRTEIILNLTFNIFPWKTIQQRPTLCRFVQLDEAPGILISVSTVRWTWKKI